MRNQTFTLLTLMAALGPAQSQTIPTDARIRVTPGQTLNRITPWMYGSCIEDVNHEIYGGLYAQRIFGESFEEPPASPLAGWAGYGGDWQIVGGSLTVKADSGAKLVRATPAIGDGSVACDVRFADSRSEHAGLILRVSDAHIGPDPWVGYEISLSVSTQSVFIGRHRHNWELLRSAPIAVQPGKWHRLRVGMSGATLRIFVDDVQAPAIEYTDAAAPILSGQVGVRTWNANASFRNLTIAANHRTTVDAMDGSEQQGGGAVSAMWDPVATGGAKARYAWEAGGAYNSARSQRIAFLGGSGAVGIANRGLNHWGIAVRQGEPMAGHLNLRSRATRSARLVVALQSADGRATYATQRLAPAGGTWARRDFELKPTASDRNARFAIWLEGPGDVQLDQVYLSEMGSRLFHGLPMRADIGQTLVDGGVRFLRYGGSMVNAPEYRWRNMVGAPDRRPQYTGWWYPHTTNGFGIVEFLRFCEAAHIEPAFAINIDETAEDAAAMVDYLTGPTTSPMGAKRAADGHPAPYAVRYIEIGNEEAIDGNRDWYARYLNRFKILYAAMHARNPKLNFVIAAWWRPEEPLCKRIAQELNGKAALWDVHVDADNLRDADRVDQTLTQMEQLFRGWIPGTKMRACIFEENGNRHDLQRALGHARILNVTQRHGDFVRMDCPANCLQPFGQNDNGWNQGQVFFLPDRVWAMPPYYAQQIASANHLPLRVACETDSPNGDLDVTATRSDDGRTLVLSIVNSAAVPHRAALQIAGGSFRTAERWELTGALTDVNPPDAPNRICPRHASPTPAPTEVELPAYSYTVLRLTR